MDTAPDDFDVVVLGAGSGGYACALRAAQLGLRVGLVEAGKLGGTCLHRGCIPAKAILHAAEIADAARHADQFGVHASLERVVPAEVLRYSDGVVDRLFKGLTGLITSRGIEVVTGSGQLVTDDAGPAIAVGERMLRAPAIVLATGSAPRSLPGLAIDGHRVITSDQALRLGEPGREELPGTAIVLGGGVIGVEFASAWRSFGVDVTVVEALERLVPLEDPALSKALERAFRKRRITVKTGVGLTDVTVDERGVRGRLGGQELRADVLLVAVGRGPVSEGLGYAEAGVELVRGYVVTDERLATAVPGVYAVGDLAAPGGAPGLQLAHRGFAHGIFLAEDLAHRAGRHDRAPVPVVDRLIPRVTYSDPELASVGLTEAVARETYGEIETMTYDLSGNGRSQILRTQGFVKLIRVADGPIVGVHLAGARVGELIGEAQLITAWEAYPDEVADLVHAHPTQDEALGEAAMALAGKSLHTHG